MTTGRPWTEEERKAQADKARAYFAEWREKGQCAHCKGTGLWPAPKENKDKQAEEPKAEAVTEPTEEVAEEPTEAVEGKKPSRARRTATKQATS